MAQFINLLSNPNETVVIEDLSQVLSLAGAKVLSIDGSNFQIVVEDNSGLTQQAQPVLTYTASATNNTTGDVVAVTEQQTVYTQSVVGVSGRQITNTAQLESGPSVYILNANDPQIQSVFECNNTNSQSGENSEANSNNQINVNLPQVHSYDDTIEYVINEQDPPEAAVINNTVKSPKQIITINQAPQQNLVAVQTDPNTKSLQFVPINKRQPAASVQQPVQILKTALQGVKTQAASTNLNTTITEGGKMRRSTNSFTATPNVVPVRSRASTGGIGTNSIVNPPRGPQARPSIHQNALQKNVMTASRVQQQQLQQHQYPAAMVSLSERIKQATTQQKDLLTQQNPQQPQRKLLNKSAIGVVQQRPVHHVQSTVQRPRGGGNVVQINRSAALQLQQQKINQTKQQLQQQLQLENLQLQQKLQLQHQQQLLQRQRQQAAREQLLRKQAAAAAAAAALNDSADEPMEVESSDNVIERQIQNCTGKADEDNSSESFAYLQQEIEDPHNAIVQRQITGNEAKMLVILENGEQRLITFEVPKEDCTVQDLLDQANIYSSQNPRVSLVSDPTLGINYIVEISPKGEEEEVVENPRAVEATAAVETQKTPVKNCNPNQATSTTMPIASPRVPKYIAGKLAVCSFCGMSASDFNYCMRCKRKLPENVKSIPVQPNTKQVKKDGLPVDTFYKKNETGNPGPGHKAQEGTAASKRGRGAARGTARITRSKNIKEPECLTISSDEEDENRRNKRVADGKESMSSRKESSSEEVDTIVDKEPLITNSSEIPDSTDPTVVQHITGPCSALSTVLACRTVRIGSYKFFPKNKIHLSNCSLKLEVPLLEDEKQMLTLEIKYTDLVKVLMHFSKSMPVLFFYPNVPTGLRIRDLLGMQDPKGPFFDPAGKDHTHKRITLLPDVISDDSKTILKEMFKNKWEDLNQKEANDILVRASPKVVQNALKKQTTAPASNSNSNGVIQTITVYPPPPAKGGIAINTEDFTCLGEDQFLNDVIIDFYLKYLTLQVLKPEDQQRTHVFSSYFYKRLTSPHTHTENTENVSSAARRHARVQKWTKNVNIFEKDFVVIPINEHAHWFLAIICFPGLVGKVAQKSDSQKSPHKKKKDVKGQVTIGNTTITPVSTITIDTADDGSERDEAEGDEEEMETDSDDDEETDAATMKEAEQSAKPSCETVVKKEINKVPCILIFDSLPGASRARVVATLRDYLSCEYQAKMGSEKQFTKDTIKGACPKVPQQTNFTDCGLYVLQYVESFFQNPIADYTLPIKTLKTWFEEIVVTRKREDLAKLLVTLMNKYKGSKDISLPTVIFPTFNGKLRPTETKVSKADADKKKGIVAAAVTAAATASTVASAVTTTTTTTTAMSVATSSTDSGESKTNAVSSTTDNQATESNNEALSKTVQAQLTTPQTPNQTSSTTDASIQKDAVTSTPNNKTMAFLKSKRISRLQKPSENQEDNQVAKKHKGESFDSCK